MRIYLTYDYELFFGKPVGTIEKCIIEPTNELRKISERTGAKFVFFIDVGYLKKLAEYKNESPPVLADYQKLTEQIRALVDEGHDCQLHIHPHWEDCTFEDGNWKMNTDRYKLSDFSNDEASRIVKEYHQILGEITQKAVTSFRAGGWCLQPFSPLQKVFKEVGIKIDSTVFPGGKFTAGNYYYDFTSAPAKDKWQFSYDLVKEEKEGDFWEYPIANHFYSPLFFWRLFALGRLKPNQHKPMGDGYPMESPGLRKKMLTKGMNLCASVDGYFVTKLPSILKKYQQKGFNELVIIGHPKACTKFALRKLEAFINSNQSTCQFLTFSDLEL